MEPQRVTVASDANDQLLYFTSSSLVGDDTGVVFISDRTGDPNLFHQDLISGRVTQLTQNRDGFLKSYVYFDGEPYRGFGKASVSLHAESGTAYFIHGREIRKATIDGTETTIAEYPAGQMTAFTHVSEDGTLLCVPTTDARALDGDVKLTGKPPFDIDARVRTEGLSSYLRVYDTATGREVLSEEVPNCWITHVQFSPRDSSLILYNHEWPSDCGIRRVWMFDGRTHRPMRTENDVRSRADWTCHEMWERDGSAVVYHGRYAGGPSYIGRVRPDGTGTTEIALAPEYTRYGHFTVGSPGVLVSDGYYETASDPETRGGDWICRLDVDWDRGAVTWTPLCRNGSSWASQDEHPHPIIDHSMKNVYFTSDKDGRRAVYRVPLTTQT